LAKLSDLGLAGPLSGDAESDPRFGKIVGTADYLSPDHIKAPWNPTPAWDIYSLGCTLYYAVTGKVPFPGGSTADKARAHCELRPLDPRRLNPELDDEFVDLMADMMAKDPGRRVPSAEAVMERLEPFLGDWAAAGTGVALPPPPRRRLGTPPTATRRRPPIVPPRSTSPALSSSGPADAAGQSRNRPIPVGPATGATEGAADSTFSGEAPNGSQADESASLIVQTTDGPAIPPPLPGQRGGLLRLGKKLPRGWRLWALLSLLALGVIGAGLAIWGLVRLIADLF